MLPAERTAARPCSCDNALLGAEFTGDQCYLCWLFHNDVDYNLGWGGGGKISGGGAPCLYRGEEIGLVPCPDCPSGKTRIKTFACSVHGSCTLGKKVEGTACCPCPDYRRPDGFTPREGDPRCGVVVGSYQWPNLIGLQIRVIRHTCGEGVPILVSDDCTSGFGAEYQGKYARLAHVCQQEGVTLWPNVERIGHGGGDVAAYWKGIVWGKALGLEYVAKLSQRCLVTAPRWLQDGARELAASGRSLAGRPCRGEEVFPLRSEIALLRVDRWSRPDLLALLTPRRVVEHRRFSAEHVLWGVFQRLGEPLHPWSLVGDDRYRPSPGVLWHCSHGPADYRQLAAEYGVELDGDFHTDGWQNSPDHLYG
jgi:hypothetical protein